MSDDRSSSRQRVHVAYFIPTLGAGGAQHHLARLALGLDRRLFTASVMTASDGPVSAKLQAGGVAVHVVRVRPEFTSTLPMIRLLRKIRPDVLHSFSWTPASSDAFFARAAGVPLVITSRLDLRHVAASTTKTTLRERFRDWLTTAVVANSHAAAALALAIEPIEASQMNVIHNGVDTPVTLPARGHLRRELQLPPEAILVAMVGNFFTWKGHQFLLEAFASISREVLNAYLCLAGEGPTRAQVETQLRALGLEKRVFVLGLRNDVDLIYPDLDVYVHSAITESFSNAILEAMANGVPVVATDVGGTAEVVVPGVNGALVPPRDSAALAAALLEMLRREPAERARLGAAGRARVMAEFTPQRMIDRHQVLYRKLLEQRGLRVDS